MDQRTDGAMLILFGTLVALFGFMILGMVAIDYFF